MQTDSRREFQVFQHAAIAAASVAGIFNVILAAALAVTVLFCAGIPQNERLMMENPGNMIDSVVSLL